MAIICELPGTAAHLSGIIYPQKTYSTSSKILTHTQSIHPSSGACQLTCLLNTVPLSDGAPAPPACGCLSGDEAGPRKAVTASVPDSDNDQTLWYSYNVFPVFSNIQNIHFQFFVLFSYFIGTG